MPGWMKHRLELRLPGETSNNLTYGDGTTLTAEREVEIKNLLMKMKEKSEKVGLKLNIQKTKIMASSPITSWQINGETVEIGRNFIFLCSKITADGDCSHEIKKHLLLGRKAMTNLGIILKSRDIIFWQRSVRKSSQIHHFSSCHVWMWELDYKISWVPKNLCFWTVVLAKILESPLDSKETQRVNPKGNQSWIFIGRTNMEAEAPILWPPDAGKDWRWEEKGKTEDEMVGWHHWLKEHELQQAPGVEDGKGSLVCWCSWITKSQTWLSDWSKLNLV